MTLLARFLQMDAVLVLMLALWYACLAYYNRRRGAQALSWVEKACAGKARIVGKKWHGTAHLQAHMGFAARWFENAQVTVRLLPRPSPLHWCLSLWRRQEETITFEADLDPVPGFQLQVFQHRWLTRKHTQMAHHSRDWEIFRPGPVVLTTRTQWNDEVTPVVNALMTSRGHNLLSVRFRNQSPHFSATLPLESVSNGQAAASFLNVLRELAAGASARQQ